MDTAGQGSSTGAVLDQIEGRWRELRSLLASLRPQDWERPLGDGWPVKVHVAHLAAWERSLLALLLGESRAAAMGIAPEVWQQHDTDAVNRYLGECALRVAASDCGALLEQSHSQVVAAIERMTDEQLSLPYSHYQPDDRPHNPRPVVDWVAGNTYEHYDEHIGWLKAGLSRA